MSKPGPSSTSAAARSAVADGHPESAEPVALAPRILELRITVATVLEWLEQLRSQSDGHLADRLGRAFEQAAALHRQLGTLSHPGAVPSPDGWSRLDQAVEAGPLRLANLEHRRTTRVLLVEGQPEQRSMMLRSLSSDHAVLAVAQADEAAGILASFEPDVVVWDVGQPEGAPAGSTRLLERALSGVEVPVLLVSEHGGRSLQQRSVSRGPSDFVVKPFAPEELQTRVANVLARQLDRAELQSHARWAQQRAEQLQGALASRVIIEQAKGMLAAETGVSVDDAFQQLRAYARRNNHRIHDVANAVVHGGFRF
ncbi:MAG: ANTAR domain-containing response regulator [Acidimicrobiia bacterium]